MWGLTAAVVVLSCSAGPSGDARAKAAFSEASMDGHPETSSAFPHPQKLGEWQPRIYKPTFSLVILTCWLVKKKKKLEYFWNFFSTPNHIDFRECTKSIDWLREWMSLYYPFLLCNFHMLYKIFKFFFK